MKLTANDLILSHSYLAYENAAGSFPLWDISPLLGEFLQQLEPGIV